MAKAYDILAIINPSLGDEDRKKLIENFQKWITQNEGEIVSFDEPGYKDIPRTYKPDTRGYYIHCEMNGTSKTLDALNAKIKVEESIVRHLIVTVDSIRDSKPVAEEAKG